jgi:hypothetical protein
MEYKYLLELLRSGLYEEFVSDFHSACVPFMDPEVYGRSILENSSFIASSANPNGKIHGKGFVARLSGSTIEYISMWKGMMFGQQPFTMKDALCFHLAPVLPAYLIDENRTVSAIFGGNMKVVYHCDGQGDFLPGNYTTESMDLYEEGKEMRSFRGDTLIGADAMAIRDSKIKELHVYLSRK